LSSGQFRYYYDLGLRSKIAELNAFIRKAGGCATSFMVEEIGEVGNDADVFSQVIHLKVLESLIPSFAD
jgi:hypothetical protein